MLFNHSIRFVEVAVARSEVLSFVLLGDDVAVNALALNRAMLGEGIVVVIEVCFSGGGTVAYGVCVCV